MQAENQTSGIQQAPGAASGQERHEGAAAFFGKCRAYLRRLAPSLVCAVTVAACFNLAYEFPSLVLLIIYQAGLVRLAMMANSGRAAFYSGLAAGFVCVTPQLLFFWTIFGVTSISLWFVLAFWIGLFVALTRMALLRFGPIRGAVLIPFLWTGLEYFRSELYYLRFSWMNAGYALSGTEIMPVLRWIGMYGLGLLMMALAVLVAKSRLRPALATMAAVAVVSLAIGGVRSSAPSVSAPSAKQFVAMGIQLEFPSESEIVSSLSRAVTSHPESDVLVLSEYSVEGPVPDTIKDWCKEHKRYLVIGGKEPVGRSDFCNTAYVVSPQGEIIFQQCKSVPIQFFRDGLPARSQALWNSPWGRIGICICYDLSYTRVTDRLIRLGAEALIVPTMDVEDWGRHEHKLHARVAPLRGAEYGIPIVRIASSGVSQITDASGRVQASAPFPGQARSLIAPVTLSGPGSLPWDRYLGPFATIVSAVALILFLLPIRIPHKSNRPC